MIGRILAGKYELVKTVGSGGMAVVYQAVRQTDGAVVAVKVLRPELAVDDEFIRRFQREAQSLSSLSNPNIVTTVDVGHEDGVYYIVMEYVPGETLKDFIRRKGPMSPDVAVYVASSVLRALKHAHDRHVIHRDIKSQNILLSRDGSVKVADFGLAKPATSNTVTVTGSNILGSVHYFSPEQARGGIAQSRSDLYSLGIVLYEMLCGDVPFHGDTPVAVAIKHIQEDAPALNEVNPSVSPAMSGVVMKAMEKDPALRYANADEMAADLRRALREPDVDFVAARKAAQQTLTAPSPQQEDQQEDELPPPPPRDSGREVFGRIIKLVIGTIVVLGLFMMLFLIGTSVYNNAMHPADIPVPDVMNLTEEQAREKLAQAELLATTTEAASATVPEGLVMLQNPKANALAAKGDMITLTLSTGPEKLLVPNVMELPLDRAKAMLEDNGFTDVKVEVEAGDFELAGGYVVRQRPEPDMQVIAGETVEIWITPPLEGEQ